MEAWLLGLGASSVIAIVYLIIGRLILSGLAHSGQWRANRLGVAMGVMFVTLGAAHTAVVVTLVLPYLGVVGPHMVAARIHHSSWLIWSTGIAAAVAAAIYLVLRSQQAALLARSALYDDLRRDRLQALEIHDNIIQGLAEAKLALEHGELESSLRTLDETLGHSRRIISTLLEEHDAELPITPGELRRSVPAGGPL